MQPTCHGVDIGLSRLAADPFGRRRRFFAGVCEALHGLHDLAVSVAPCMLEGMSGSGDEERGDAFKRAFGDVQPLRGRSVKRVARTSDPGPANAVSRRRSGHAGATLVVEREGNGIVTGRRKSTHPSIVDALEDPRLEVEAELDLHGRTTKEAEREVARFLHDSQRRGRGWVCIVVGKGLHSPGGKGALRDHVVGALSGRAPARFVLAFRTAPRHLGGTGALVVRLADRA